MIPFKRILIGMDQSNTDLQLLDYVKMLYPIQKPEKIYCTHVVKELALPSFVRDRKGDFKIKPLDERLKKNLEDEVRLKLRPGSYEVECDILEGKITQQLLHWAEVKGIDLSILGRKVPASGNGISAKIFLRKSPSSVLFVPHKKKHKIKRIALATDFSKTSTYSLLKIRDWIARIPGEVKLSLIHVYDIPSAVSTQTGGVFDILTKKIKKTTEEFAYNYLDQLDISKDQVELRLIENGHINPGKFIYEEAKDLQVDLLVMGAQGHSLLGNFILGSVSEKVHDLNQNIPLLIIRPILKELENIASFSIKNFKSLEHA